MAHLIRTSLIFSLIVTSAVMPTFAFAEESGTTSVQLDPNQEIEAEAKLPKFWDMITLLPRDLKTFGKETLTQDGLILTGGLLAMTAATVASDYQTWQVARVPTDTDEVAHKFANAMVSTGDGFFQFGIVGAFAAGGFVTSNVKALRTASQLTESILATGIVVQLIKHTTGRESPFSSDSRTGVWRMFANQYDYHKDFQKHDAVPSGHLSTAVTTLVVIQENYPAQKWISYIGWPLMGAIGWGLAGTGIHWWSDYPLAIAIGYSFAKIATRENNPRLEIAGQNETSLWHPKLMPTLSSEGDPILMAGWTF